MPRSSKNPDAPDDTDSTASDSYRNKARDSAQQIWLAGLGAFAKAQQEGGKVFEALVKEGAAMQRKTQSTAQERLSEAAERMTSAASEFGTRAAGQWDKLETIFEDRVAKALARLGVPTAREVQALHERIDALTQALEAATNAQAAPPRPAAKRGAAKPATGRATAARKTAAARPRAGKPPAD
ncbi:phasin family protein [Paracidovorax valerianellae]|uniref:Poly(Hydroxyalkanoate) granule-associated protein n=1 Tax=Paracidovorax valerianellae TaxID=187868 RepID=A0A1G7BKX2_9BURK|nr:phasin family protein [Paracidovorax valerianellae]MDA8445951.1 phasin family protein [Paracidovorax valerianellae]SDE27748.1 poly(hydroxyalkanoate) granule-associated protein [Paracidovorax valerianellae]